MTNCKEIGEEKKSEFITVQVEIELERKHLQDSIDALEYGYGHYGATTWMGQLKEILKLK